MENELVNSELVVKDELVNIEVIYALEDEQKILRLSVAKKSTVAEVIKQSGILKLYPQIDLDQSQCGIYSHVVTMEQIVKEGERIEIYRPLICDPKEVRKQRALAAKQAKQKKKSR